MCAFRTVHCQNGLNGQRVVHRVMEDKKHEPVTSFNVLQMADNNVPKSKVKLKTVMIKHAHLKVSKASET